MSDTSPKVTECIKYFLAKCNTVNSIIGASEPPIKQSVILGQRDILTHSA